MYMRYLLEFNLYDKMTENKEKLENDPELAKLIRMRFAENTFILALDGDVDFKPKAVQRLMERMKKDRSVGAACGRIHPIGSGRNETTNISDV